MTLEQENKCLQMQLDRALKDYDELEERIDKIKEEIKYYSNADMCYENDTKFINKIIDIVGGNNE